MKMSFINIENEEDHEYGFFCDLENIKDDYPEQNIKITNKYSNLIIKKYRMYIHKCIVAATIFSSALLTYHLFIVLSI